VVETQQLESVSCQSCGAELRVQPPTRSVRCPYCDSSSVVERPTSEAPDPTFVIGFVLDQERATRRVRSWLSSRGLFTDPRFKRAAVENTRGVYLPAYLYGARADTRYQAEIGENYTVTETYTTTDSDGNSVTRTRTKTVTEWRPLRGEHACYQLDFLISASRGLPNAELEAVEPFDLRALARYQPEMVAGWTAEDPSIDWETARGQAHDEGLQDVGRRLVRFMPGDSHQGLSYRCTFSDEVCDPVLLPLWIFAMKYREDRPLVRVVLNGQTGEVVGRAPTSALRVTVAVLLGLVLVGGVALLIAWGVGSL